jgi:hypothetical protein
MWLRPDSIAHELLAEYNFVTPLPLQSELVYQISRNDPSVLKIKTIHTV